MSNTKQIQPKDPEKWARIIEKLNNNITAKAIAEEEGCSVDVVYRIGRLSGVPVKQGHKENTERMQEARAKRIEEVTEYRKQGHSISETAEHFGISIDSVKWYGRGLNLGAAKEPPKLAEEEIREAISRKGLPFEFVSTYKMGKDHKHLRKVVVRCKECGSEFSRVWESIRQGKAECLTCRENRQQAERKAREEAEAKIRKEKAQRREQMVLWYRATKKLIRVYEKAIAAQQQRRECPVCGTVTTNPVYCCIKCRNKAQNKRAEVSRRHKVKALMVDKDITLEGLIKRDGGICHICKWPCDSTDWGRKGKTIVCGDMYPSIDHIKPLAKGGKHSWANVKLAHRICNSLKGAM